MSRGDVLEFVFLTFIGFFILGVSSAIGGRFDLALMMFGPGCIAIGIGGNRYQVRVRVTSVSVGCVLLLIGILLFLGL